MEVKHTKAPLVQESKAKTAQRFIHNFMSVKFDGFDILAEMNFHSFRDLCLYLFIYWFVYCM